MKVRYFQSISAHAIPLDPAPLGVKTVLVLTQPSVVRMVTVAPCLYRSVLPVGGGPTTVRGHASHSHRPRDPRCRRRPRETRAWSRGSSLPPDTPAALPARLEYPALPLIRHDIRGRCWCSPRPSIRRSRLPSARWP